MSQAESDSGLTQNPQTSKVITIAAGHAAHDTYSAFLPPLLPVFIERLSLARAEAGLLTVFLQGPSLLQPVIGHLGDHRDLRLAAVLSPAVTAVCMSLVGVAPGYGALVLLLLTAGLSAAVLHSVAPVLAGRLSGRRLGYAMGFWMVGGELGRTLGPVLVVSTVALLGLGGMPWLMIGGLAASALLALGLRGVRAEGVRADKPRDLSQTLRSMRPLLIPLIGIVISRAFMMAASTTYLPVFLREDGDGLWVAGASLSVLGGVADWMGMRWTFLACAVLALAGTPFVTWIPGRSGRAMSQSTNAANDQS